MFLLGVKTVTPDRLYAATATRRFIKRCKNCKVNWAIFSDKYGIWFADTENTWYEKDPNKVTDEEFNILMEDFNSKLKGFDEIWFYYNPGRFHPREEGIHIIDTLNGEILYKSHNVQSNGQPSYSLLSKSTIHHKTTKQQQDKDRVKTE